MEKRKRKEKLFVPINLKSQGVADDHIIAVELDIYENEKKWIQFPDCITKAQAGARMLFGLLGFYVFNIIICPWIKNTLGGIVGTTASCFVLMFYITAVFPALIIMVERFSAKGDR